MSYNTDYRTLDIPTSYLDVNQSGGYFGQGFISFIARLMISALFIIMGIRSAMNFPEYVELLTSTGVPNPTLIGVVFIILQIFGGLFFTGIFTFDRISLGRLSLMLYLIGDTIVSNNAFKDPYKLEGMLKNIAIFGGLLIS